MQKIKAKVGIAFGTVMGGAGAALTGGNFWQGAVTGLVVSGLNHVAHKMHEKSQINKAIRRAGFDPNDAARWNNEELTNNISKIFPDLYESANNPKFEIQDVIGGQDNIYGQAPKTVSGSPGNYKVESKGLIYIKKLALNTIMHVASVAGHELNHLIDYVSGNYQNWANQNGPLGIKAANAHTEINAYTWEMNNGSYSPNYSQLILNRASMSINNWKY